MNTKGLLIVISGPSGSGKSTVNSMIRERMPGLKKSISVTTRNKRAGEIEGIHYYFRSLQEYQQMIADGKFLETAEVYTNYYGSLKQPVFDMLASGYDVLFELDTMGAKQIRSAYPESVLVYIAPPSVEELESRLRNRGTDSEDSIRLRLRMARREFEELKHYDYIIVNDDPVSATEKLIAIINAEKCDIKRNAVFINKLMK